MSALGIHPWTGDAELLAQRIARFQISSFDEPSESFESLALAIYRWQLQHDPVLAALVEHEPHQWQEIPAIPVGLFKDLPVGTVTPGTEARAFRTSGTTGGGRGEHRLRSTFLYDQGALIWSKRYLTSAFHQTPPATVVALLEDPVTAPDASLAHMVALFKDFANPPGTAHWFVTDGELNRDGVNAHLAQLSQPIFFATTAFAIAEWLDGPIASLPPASIIMVTGGFKGRMHRLDDVSLWNELRKKFPETSIVCEYGMTELSSQLWGLPGYPYYPPPWLRAIAIDRNGQPLPNEQRGQLRFYDLANLDGTLGIETLDEGIVHLNGSVTLLGRSTDAPVRGCSLTIEEAWARRVR